LGRGSHAFSFQLFDVFLSDTFERIVRLDRRRHRLTLPVEAGIEAGGKELFRLVAAIAGFLEGNLWVGTQT
jgi:hypothetical protein